MTTMTTLAPANARVGAPEAGKGAWPDQGASHAWLCLVVALKVAVLLNVGASVRFA